MNKEDILLKLAEKLLDCDTSVSATPGCTLTGKPVIVRCRDAGVHFGYLRCYEGRKVELTKTRRMWRWWASKQMTLSAVAEFGLNENKDLRIQNELSEIILLEACEIIPCSQECVASFARVEPYNEQ